MKAFSFLFLLQLTSIFIFSQSQSIVSKPQVLESKDFSNIQVRTLFFYFLGKMIQTDPTIVFDFFSLFGFSECWGMFVLGGDKDKLLIGLVYKGSNQSGLW